MLAETELETRALPTGDVGMRVALSTAQRAARARFRAYVAEHVAPQAAAWDREAAVPQVAIDQLRAAGLLGTAAPQEVGGGGFDPITYGLLTEEIGRGCSSLRSLLTVHDMVSLAALRWGSAELKAEVAPKLARAERLGALALSEPEVGSDAAAVTTRAERQGDGWVLDGRKKWTTFGEVADEFLVLARSAEGLVAFLVPIESAGFRRTPLEGMVGTRASLLAELFFEGCFVPEWRRVGRVGFGLSHVVATALDHGRYSVAWGSVGIAQACLDACLDYSAKRVQGGAVLAEHQLVRRRLAEMIARTEAARLLCCRAGTLRAERDPAAVSQTMIAKYFASQAAVASANDAVHLHGANGLSTSFPLERYLRDAKVAEIIEGSTEIQQLAIPRYPLSEL
jgi:glutaryl-CoA dehydrogenase (non-decarboxylating)